MGVLLSLHAPSGTMRLACNLAGLVPHGGCDEALHAEALCTASRNLPCVCSLICLFMPLLLFLFCPPPLLIIRRQAYPQDLLGGSTPASAAVRRGRHQHRRGAAGARRRPGPAARRPAAAAYTDAGMNAQGAGAWGERSAWGVLTLMKKESSGLRSSEPSRLGMLGDGVVYFTFVCFLRCCCRRTPRP